jgi:hypothetical protein
VQISEPLVTGNLSGLITDQLTSNKLDRTTVVAGIQNKPPKTTTPLGKTSCGTDIDCDKAAEDGCAYTTDGKTFVARCNMDFYGSDMSLISTDDLESCITDCTQTVGCKSVSWSTGTCYLKSAIPKGDYSQWVQGMSHRLRADLKRVLTG